MLLYVLLQSGLPKATIPALRHADVILGYSMSVVLLAFMESYSVSKQYAVRDHTHLDVNQELLALGVTNLLGSFFSCPAVSGSFGRTAVAYNSGARTPLFNIISGLVILTVLAWLTPLFYYVPTAALGAIIVFALYKLLDLKVRSLISLPT